MAEPIVTVKFKGGDELQKVLKSLPAEMAKKILRQATVDAATVWQQDMMERAPKLESVKLATKAENVRIPGYLSRHIVISTRVNEDLEASAKVGPSKSAFYALFIELGWKVRQSLEAGKHYRRWMRRRAEVKGRVEGRRFIEQSFESKRESVLAKFIESAKRILSEELSKHANR